MWKEQAVGLIANLIKHSKLTEEERNAYYQALKFLSELDGSKEAKPVELKEAK